MSASFEFSKTRAAFMQLASAPELSPFVLKLAYLIAFKYMNKETGMAIIRQETLALDLKVQERSVRNYLSILRKFGLQVDVGNGRGIASVYRLAGVPVPDHKDGTQEPPFASKRRHLGTAFSGQKGGTQDAQKAAPRNPPTNKKGNQEGGTRPRAPEARPTPQAPQGSAAAPMLPMPVQPSSINEASAASAFAGFAQVYPKKTGMSAAQTAFMEACDVADSNLIVARAKLYAKDFEGERARYAIPPKQWLQERCFNDPLPDGATITIDQRTDEITIDAPAPRHKHNGETWDEKVARLLQEDSDVPVH